MPYGSLQPQTPRGGPRPQPRVQHRPAGGGAPSPRILIAGLLVLATLFGGYWFLLRAGGESPDAFLKAEERIAAAARTVPESAADVQRFLELEAFNAAIDEQLIVIRAETAKLRKVARESDGDAAVIARNSVDASTRIATSTVSYRDAIIVSGDLADADAARLDIEASTTKLEQQARAWKKL